MQQTMLQVLFSILSFFLIVIRFHFWLFTISSNNLVFSDLLPHSGICCLMLQPNFCDVAVRFFVFLCWLVWIM